MQAGRLAVCLRARQRCPDGCRFANVPAICLSVAAAFVASSFPVACSRATVASGTCAILGRRRAIVGSGLALGLGDLGMIWFERVADRGADVSLCGSSVSCLCRTISGLGRAIGLVEVVLPGHGTKRSHVV